MAKIEIACLGENEDIIIFNGIGITPFVIKSRHEIIEKIDELAALGTKVIIVSDIFQQAIADTLEKYQDDPFPIILMLPLGGIETGLGLEKIQKDVERAIGINIFQR